MEKVCGISGHRPQHFPFGYDEEDPRCREFKMVLFEELFKLSQQGCHTFLSGMAQGTDLWAAECILALRRHNAHLRLTCVLPCPGQEKYWPREQRERYTRILQEADEVLCLSPSYYKACMFQRNRYMVDHCDVLLAVYDGSNLGGTAYTLRYARKKGKEIRLLHPKEYKPTALLLAHRISAVQF